MSPHSGPIEPEFGALAAGRSACAKVISKIRTEERRNERRFQVRHRGRVFRQRCVEAGYRQRARFSEFFHSLPANISRRYPARDAGAAGRDRDRRLSLDFADARTQLANLRILGRRHGARTSTFRSWPRAPTRWPSGRGCAPRRSRATARSCTTCRWSAAGRCVCGMHVHVEVPDLRQRVDIMNRIQPYLPLLLALSTSSPFWQAQRTGLLGYRLAAYRELPRTGLPGPVRERAGLPALHRYPGGGPGHREFELCLVGHPAVAEASDPRAARRRQLHPARRHASRSRRSIAASCGA